MVVVVVVVLVVVDVVEVVLVVDVVVLLDDPEQSYEIKRKAIRINVPQQDVKQDQ